MNKNLALYLLKIMKDYENTDYNDVLNFVELILANKEEVTKLLNIEDWKISNKYSSKTVSKSNLNIGFKDWEWNENEEKEEFDCLNLYLLDGYGTRRVIAKSNKKYIDVEYKHRSLEEVSKILEEVKLKCKAVLPENDNYISTNLVKSDLLDYSEKCYKDTKHNMYIPKSVVAFDEEKVVVIEWFFNKNKYILGIGF